jgi:hypothetical protein
MNINDLYIKYIWNEHRVNDDEAQFREDVQAMMLELIGNDDLLFASTPQFPADEVNIAIRAQNDQKTELRQKVAEL